MGSASLAEPFRTLEINHEEEQFVDSHDDPCEVSKKRLADLHHQGFISEAEYRERLARLNAPDDDPFGIYSIKHSNFVEYEAQAPAGFDAI